MLNLLVSIVRTNVPIFWGLVVSWLTAKGILTKAAAAAVAGDTTQAALVGAVLLVITTATYALVRTVETNLPRILGRFLPADVTDAVVKLVTLVLLGVPKPPTYANPVT